MDAHTIFKNRKYKEVAKFIKPNSKILDIGCNKGDLNNFLLNCKYYGVDIDIFPILNKKGIIAKKADLNIDKIPFEKIKFNYVVLLDVVEHVIDPKRLLIESKERLDENGKLIVTLPNDYHILNKLRFIFNKPLTIDPFSPHTHLHHFSVKSGEKFLESLGFKILNKKYIVPEKPAIIPFFIKKFLTIIMPGSFARDVLYVLS